MKIMTRCIAAILAVGFPLVVGLATLPSGLHAQETGASSEPAAVVNGEAISRAALQVETRRMMEQLAGQGQMPTEEMLPQLREEVLTQMIDEELLYQASRDKDISVPETRVAEELASIKERFPGEKEFSEALKGMELSEEDLARKIRRGVAIEQLLREHVLEDVTVSEEESRAYYDQNAALFERPEQVEARHILIRTEDKTTEDQKAEARRKIEAVREKAVAGEDFGALAKEYSEDPGNTGGGELGYFSRGQMVKPFEDAAFSLKKGEISDIVETRFGYHLIEVTDRQPASMVAYETARVQIAEQLKQEKSRRQIRTYIEQLREEADIERKS